VVQAGGPPRPALAELCALLPLPDVALALLEVLRALPEVVESARARLGRFERIVHDGILLKVKRFCCGPRLAGRCAAPEWGHA
jgi:hypothetical protein